jgi:hypothetical protein
MLIDIRSSKIYSNALHPFFMMNQRKTYSNSGIKYTKNWILVKEMTLKVKKSSMLFLGNILVIEKEKTLFLKMINYQIESILQDLSLKMYG